MDKTADLSREINEYNQEVQKYQNRVQEHNAFLKVQKQELTKLKDALEKEYGTSDLKELKALLEAKQKELQDKINQGLKIIADNTPHLDRAEAIRNGITLTDQQEAAANRAAETSSNADSATSDAPNANVQNNTSGNEPEKSRSAGDEGDSFNDLSIDI